MTYLVSFATPRGGSGGDYLETAALAQGYARLLDAKGFLVEGVTEEAGERPPLVDIMTAEYAAFLGYHGLPEEGDATEMLMAVAELTNAQRGWLTDFVDRWEAAARADPDFYDKQAVYRTGEFL